MCNRHAHEKEITQMPRKQSARKRTKDVYTRITDRIVADLEKGVRPWIKPWNAEHMEGRIMRPLRHNGLPYSGINVLMLWSASIEFGFGSPMWMTYRQSQELGAQVRKGEKGSLVVYANRMTVTEANAEGEEQEREVPYLKGYTVFNVAQIDGLPENYHAKPESRFDAVERIEHADRFFEATRARIRYGGARAFYSTGSDHIHMPPIEAFRDAESFYSTLGHECVHWSGAGTRLDRDLRGKRFGSQGYAREELIAELGAAFLCADLEITPEVRDDHACYLASWLRVLKDDKRAIVSAAAQAQRAVDYLHGLQSSAPIEDRRVSPNRAESPSSVQATHAASAMEAAR